MSTIAQRIEAAHARTPFDGLLLASPAGAGSVFLNDVPVDGLTDQRFEKATVTFDAQGNVLHMGTNHIGRYPLHLHHVMGPVAAPAVIRERLRARLPTVLR